MVTEVLSTRNQEPILEEPVSVQEPKNLVQTYLYYQIYS